VLLVSPDIDVTVTVTFAQNFKYFFKCSLLLNYMFRPDRSSSVSQIVEKLLHIFDANNGCYCMRCLILSG
jgi:hypothetical protein